MEQRRKKNHGRCWRLNALLLLESLPKTLQRHVEALVWGLGGGGEVGEMTEKTKRRSKFPFSSLFLWWKTSPLSMGFALWWRSSENLPLRFPNTSPLRQFSKHKNPGIEPWRGGQGQQHLEAVNLLMWWRIRAVIELNVEAGGTQALISGRHWGEGEVRTKQRGYKGLKLNMLLQRLFISDAEGMEKHADRRRRTSGQLCSTKLKKNKRKRNKIQVITDILSFAPTRQNESTHLS